MNTREHHRTDVRRLRLLASAAAVLFTLTMLVRFWPAPSPTPPRPLPPGPEHIVAIEEIVSTTQAAAQNLPPPPPDLPPIEVEDVELEEVPLTLDVPLTTIAPTPGPPSEAPPGESDTAQRPSGGITRAPQSVSPVFPTIRRDDPHVEVVVEVVVEPTGRVSEARILERYTLGRNDQRVAVAAVEPRIEEEALRLARQWRFRPALRDGERVAQPLAITLTWGR